MYRDIAKRASDREVSARLAAGARSATPRDRAPLPHGRSTLATRIRCFRPLHPRERASIRETRLRIVPARGGETLAELSQRTGNAWNLQQTAVANGLFADARLEEGQLLKVAISQPYKAPPPR